MKEKLNKTVVVAVVMGAAVMASMGVMAMSGTVGDATYELVKGSKWTYAVTQPENSYEVTKEVMGFVDVNAGKAAEIKSVYGKYENYEYLRTDGVGLYSHYNRLIQGPGVDEISKPLPLLDGPVRAGATFRWFAPWRGQTAGDVSEEKIKSWGYNCTAKVISVNAEIEVPAGTFKTIHVSHEAINGEGNRYTSEYWISPKVGMVKRVTNSDTGVREEVLKAFTIRS